MKSVTEGEKGDDVPTATDSILFPHESWHVCKICQVNGGVANHW